MKEEAIRTQNGADVLKWWTFMATDVIAHVSFGESFHMIETGKVSIRCSSLSGVCNGC